MLDVPGLKWEASGATGWGWRDLKPYFAKAEGFTPSAAHKIDESVRPPLPFLDALGLLLTTVEQMRGKEGVWKTGYPTTSPVVAAWVESGVRRAPPPSLSRVTTTRTTTLTFLGVCCSLRPVCRSTRTSTSRRTRTACVHPLSLRLSLPARPLPLRDVVADEDLYVAQITRFQATVDSKGQRSSTSAAYLPPSVYTRRNLSILTSTRCSKILLGPGQDGAQRCVGVELQQERNGKTFVARAKHDVILSLGTFGTPQLLLCSGVGGKEKAEAAGVVHKLDLPGVGEGLKDHFLAGIFFRAKSGTSFEFLKSQLRTVRLGASPSSLLSTRELTRPRRTDSVAHPLAHVRHRRPRLEPRRGRRLSALEHDRARRLGLVVDRGQGRRRLCDQRERLDERRPRDHRCARVVPQVRRRRLATPLHLLPTGPS